MCLGLRYILIASIPQLQGVYECTLHLCVHCRDLSHDLEKSSYIPQVQRFYCMSPGIDSFSLAAGVIHTAAV